MNIKSAALVLSATLLLAACGGSDSTPASPSTSEAAPSPAGAPEGGGEDSPPSMPPGVAMEGPVTQQDVGELGKRLGWEGCDEPDVDMAGYPVVLCIFPNEYAVPGQDGNAVRVMTFTEWDQAMQYVLESGNPDAVTVMDGYIVDGPHAKAVDAAVAILER